jgi:hypothetical protein
MSKLVAGCLLFLALCGCQKNEDKPPGDPATMGCANALRTIAKAKERWAQQSGANSNSAPTWDDLDQYFRPQRPHCPSGGTYTIGAVGESPKCSIASHNQYYLTNQVLPP